MASTPNKIAEIETTKPTIPTIIPIITNKPSFPSNPKEIINTPSPGIKLESGIGIKTKAEKTKEKNPIILSIKGEIINNKRGLRILSTLRI